MQAPTVNKVKKTWNSGRGVGVLQALAILEYLVLCNAREQILKNGDVLIVQEKDVSKIEETNAVNEVFCAIGGCAEIGKGKQIIDMEEFREAWGKGLVDWDSKCGILEEQVGGYHEMDIRELGERQVDNAIEESQLGNPNIN